MFPNRPIVNRGNKYVQDCNLFYVDEANIRVSSGQVRDITNVNDIQVNSSVLVNTNVVGAGGLDTGTIGANKLYAVYVLGNSNDNPDRPTFSAMLSENFLVPDAYAPGFDMVRRVGAISTDGSSNIRNFFQTGKSLDRYMWYNDLIQVVNLGGTTSFQTVDCSHLIPSIDSACEIIVTTQFVTVPSNPFASTVFFRPTGSTAANGLVQTSTSDASYFSTTFPAAGIASFQYAVNALSIACNLFVSGYIDSL